MIAFIGNLIFNKNKVTETAKKITVSPNVTNQTTPTPTPTPIDYHFNKSTDLKSELDSINPEVLDSDFSNLKSTINQL